MKQPLLSPVFHLMVGIFLAFSTNAQPLDVVVSHDVTEINTYSDGTSSVTLAVTIHNQSSENLTDFRLLPLHGVGFMPEPFEQALEIDTLASGATLEQNWSINSMGGLSIDSPLFAQILLAAEAIDASQTLHTFPINSIREAE